MVLWIDEGVWLVFWVSIIFLGVRFKCFVILVIVGMCLSNLESLFFVLCILLFIFFREWLIFIVLLLWINCWILLIIIGIVYVENLILYDKLNLLMDFNSFMYLIWNKLLGL